MCLYVSLVFLEYHDFDAKWRNKDQMMWKSTSAFPDLTANTGGAFFKRPDCRFFAKQNQQLHAPGPICGPGVFHYVNANQALRDKAELKLAGIYLHLGIEGHYHEC